MHYTGHGNYLECVHTFSELVIKISKKESGKLFFCVAQWKLKAECGPSSLTPFNLEMSAFCLE